MKRFLLLMGMVFTAAAALGQGDMRPMRPERPETISVSGTGRTTLVPDRYTFSVGVQTVATTVDAAVNANNQRMTDIRAALKKAGATDAEIRTSNFSLNPQQDYTQGNLPRILGYQVNNTLSVTRSNMGDAGKLLQAAVNAGVNTSSGLQFEVSDPARGRDVGLKAAYDDARAKAEVLARAAGRAVGRALSISEGGVPEPPRPLERGVMMMKAQAVSEIPVESGTQELTYSVGVVFELR